MTAFDLFTIGHSNIPADRFVAMLRGAGANAVADVRSVPASRFFPWFSARKLGSLLEREGVTYLRYGEELGGRPRDQSLYRNGIADYEAMARQPEFHAAIERLLADASRQRVCLMCAEREPFDCHRCLLVARALTGRGLGIGHILHDGGIEPHADTEKRLVALDGEDQERGDLFITGQSARLAAAYRRRVHAVAYRMKPARGGATPRRPENSR
jgi:uncharacterized protein (DUF488 family)